MNILDVIKSVGNLTKAFSLIEKRVDDGEKTDTKHAEELAALRKEIAQLTTRVAVLEEGRKTIAAENKQAMSEVIAQYELYRRDEKLKELEQKLAEEREGNNRLRSQNP